MDDDGQVEQAAGARADGLGVQRVDAVAGQDDGVGAGRIGAADDGAGVAGVADVGAHHDEAGIDRQVVERADHAAAARDQPLGRDGVRDLGEHRLVDGVPLDAVDHARSRYVDVREDLEHHAVDGEGLADGLRALGEELPGLGSERTSGEPPSVLPRPLRTVSGSGLATCG